MYIRHMHLSTTKIKTTKNLYLQTSQQQQTSRNSDMIHKYIFFNILLIAAAVRKMQFSYPSKSLSKITVSFSTERITRFIYQGRSGVVTGYRGTVLRLQGNQSTGING